MKFFSCGILSRQVDSHLPRYAGRDLSELDMTRNEIRKVEVFRDGSLGWASRTGAGGGTQLGLEAVPPVLEITREAEFSPRGMSREEFEAVWARAAKAR